MLNFVYARLVRNMDQKGREEFDSTLSSGVSSSVWDRLEARAWERLQAGEFDRGTALHDGGGE